MPLLHQDIFSLGPFLLYRGCAKFISWWAARDTKYVSDLIMSCLSNWSMCSAKLFQNRFFIDRRRKDLVVLIQDPRMHQCREIVQESSHQEDTQIHRQKMIQWVKINQKETHRQVHQWEQARRHTLPKLLRQHLRQCLLMRLQLVDDRQILDPEAPRNLREKVKTSLCFKHRTSHGREPHPQNKSS